MLRFTALVLATEAVAGCTQPQGIVFGAKPMRTLEEKGA